MNITNFFRFIGEKKPEYKISSDNKKLIDTIKNGYEERMVDGEEFEGDAFNLIPLPVEGKGYFDENGKQGLFINIRGEHQIEKGYWGESNTHDFSYFTKYTTYKNDVKNGTESAYYDSDRKKLWWTIEFVDGKKNGLEHSYTRNGGIRTISKWVNNRLTQRDTYYMGDESGLLQTIEYYTPTEVYNGVIRDRPDPNRPTRYFLRNGEEVNKETFDKRMIR